MQFKKKKNCNLYYNLMLVQLRLEMLNIAHTGSLKVQFIVFFAYFCCSVLKVLRVRL